MVRLKLLIRIQIIIAASVCFGCAYVNPLPVRANVNLPEVDYDEALTTTHSAFNVRGYVMGVIICGRRNVCISEDGVYLSTVPDKGLGDSTFWGSDNLKRFNLEAGQEYLISYKRMVGIIGATKLAAE